MKILLATSSAIPTGGGIASYNQELLKILGKTNQLYLITDSDESNVKGYVETISLYNKKIYSYDVCKDLISQINSEQYDLIINSRSSIMPVIAPFVNAPIISVAHYVNGFQADNAGYNNKYVSSIIALSYYCKDYLKSKFKISEEEKIKVVYNFVSDSQKPFDNLKYKNTEPVIVFPGGTSRHKGFDMVIVAVKKLLKTNLKFKFYWVGDVTLSVKNLSVQQLYDLRQFFGQDKRLIITGRIPRQEAEQIFASANIFVLPSRGEGCPMSLLEAMRAGCIPIISDAKHGSLELIRKLGCGEIIKNCTGTSLYRRMRFIIENIEKYEDCYQKTYNFSRTFLSQLAWSNQMSSIISSSIKEKKIVETLTEEKFCTSCRGYLKLYKKDRLKIKMEGLIMRVKLEFYYLLFRFISVPLK